MSRRHSSSRFVPITADMDISHAKFFVKSHLPVNLLPILEDRVVFHPKSQNFWGSEQPTSFVKIMTTLALYKDLTGHGYQKIIESLELGFYINIKSFLHNVKIIRKILFEWSRELIVNEGEKSWQRMAQNFLYKKGLEEAN